VLLEFDKKSKEGGTGRTAMQTSSNEIINDDVIRRCVKQYRHIKMACPHKKAKYFAFLCG